MSKTVFLVIFRFKSVGCGQVKANFSVLEKRLLFCNSLFIIEINLWKYDLQYCVFVEFFVAYVQLKE